jgi:hypothetical protein
MIRSFVAFAGKWTVVVPAIAIVLVVMLGIASKQEAVYGYGKVVDNGSFALGVGIFTVPDWISGILEAKKVVQADNKGQSAVTDGT